VSDVHHCFNLVGHISTVGGSLHEVVLDLVDVDGEVNILVASGGATVHGQGGAQEGKWAVAHPLDLPLLGAAEANAGEALGKVVDGLAACVGS
jgi:hypothetical protein